MSESEGDEFWYEAFGGEGELDVMDCTFPVILILEDWVRASVSLSLPLIYTLWVSD